MIKIMIFSPHPDDAELGMGGSIIKFINEGHKVIVIDITSGEPTPFGSSEKRKRETIEATKILGLKERINLELENRYLMDTKEARIRVAEQIRLFRPDIIFCPYHWDAHPDHIATYHIVKGARFYAKYTKTNMKADPHYTPHLVFYFCTHLRVNNKFSFLVDISKYFTKKIKAVACYKSQFIENTKNRSIFRFISSQNSYWGSLIRAKYAEAFYTEEAIKIEDISTII